jgi:hypothetical protein
MSDSEFTTDSPYLRVYPELNVFDLPLVLFLLLSLLFAIPFLVWNGLYHVIHLFGFSVGPEKAVLVRAIISDGVLADPIRGRLISIGVIIATVVYMYVLLFTLKRMYPKFTRGLWNLKNVSVSTWNFDRFRKLFVHAVYSHVAYWSIFLAMWLIWFKYIFPSFDQLFIAGGIFIVAFFMLIIFGTLFKGSSRGIEIIDWYFRVVGGYDDGSMGRKLHISYNTLEGSFDRDDLESIIPVEIFDSVVDEGKLED